VIDAYQHALTPVFGYLVPLFVAALILALWLPEKKLAETHDHGEAETTPPERVMQKSWQPGPTSPGHDNPSIETVEFERRRPTVIETDRFRFCDTAAAPGPRTTTSQIQCAQSATTCVFPPPVSGARRGR
jgi:hypothetical protein